MMRRTHVRRHIRHVRSGPTSVREHMRRIDAREEILAPYLKDQEYSGGLKSIDDVPPEALEKLLKKRLADPQARQNNSPTITEFLEFMKKHKHEGVRAHGYIVSPQRPDTRVSIEGLRVTKPVGRKFREDWRRFNSSADELDDKRSWWD